MTTHEKVQAAIGLVTLVITWIAVSKMLRIMEASRPEHY